MKLALVRFTSIEISNESEFINDFSDKLKQHFENRNYGKDIRELVIGVICVSANYEPFFKVRKPGYIKDKKKIISQYTKVEYNVERLLEYDIKLDFETFKNGTEAECRRLLAKEILNSLSVVESMKSKIKDFDLEKFKADLESYLKEQKLV
ncbi:MAG: hypothetical protein HY062_11110 [Bacteroidetes bacterium]|nr:hypothetical protein [Bacteroidota bacterium]